MEKPSAQFVLLHHVGHGPEHWDLMLEAGELLATWQILRDPTRGGSTSTWSMLPARRIGDHRRTYLDYQGPVAGGRGRVTRIDHGEYHLIRQSPAGWVIRLLGEELSGGFELRPGRAALCGGEEGRDALGPVETASDDWELHRLD